jgi:hypothetical protein
MLSSQSIAAKMPVFLNKNNRFYKALIGDMNASPEETIKKSSDFNEGAICNEIDFLKLFVKKIAGIKDIHQLEEPYLDYLVEIATGLERFPGESNESFLNRILAITERKNNRKRVTKWTILDFFRYFYEKVYMIETNAENNLILNKTFEEGFANWQIENSVSIVNDPETAFMGVNLVKADLGGKISQTIEVDESYYTLYFFAKGDVSFYVTDENGRYYDFVNEIWTSSIIDKSLSLGFDDWRIAQVFVKVLGNTKLTLTIESRTAKGFELDFVECGKYLGYPSFNVLLKADSEEIINIKGFFDFDAYYDHDFFLAGDSKGINESYFDYVLDTIKAGGVKASYELIE